MNKAHGLTTENLLCTLPEALRKDESVYALASAIADVLSSRPGEIESLMIYSRIDQLPEPLLDMLAVDFKVDWWSADYSLEEKRATLKDSWNVHRRLGTKYALEQAISDIYPQTTVQEWWEYEGKPYCFRIMIGNFDEVADPQELLKIRRAISQVKRLSAHLDGIDISSAVLEVQGRVGGALPPPLTVDTVPARRDEPRLRKNLTIQGGYAGLAVTTVKETNRDAVFYKNCYSAGGFTLDATDRLQVWEDDSVYYSPLQFCGGAMNVTETEVLHL